PSDLLVSRSSVGAISAPVTEKPFLHTEMTGSEPAFKDFVGPQLKKQADEYRSDPDPLPPAAASSPAHFTKGITGHVDARTSQEVTVILDRVSVASFALFDPTRSLKVTIRGASGNVINLNPDEHGLIQISDPATMITLGYGFDNPQPGPWRVQLAATPATPKGGADFALSSKVIGGATLNTQADKLVAQTGQPITIRASLTLAQAPMNESVLRGTVRDSDGKSEEVGFVKSGDENRAIWKPKEPGIYAVDITAKGTTPDGLQVERANFLTVQVEPDPNRAILRLTLLAIGILTLLTLIGFWLKQRRSRKIQPTKWEL